MKKLALPKITSTIVRILQFNLAEMQAFSQLQTSLHFKETMVSPENDTEKCQMNTSYYQIDLLDQSGIQSANVTVKQLKNTKHTQHS